MYTISNYHVGPLCYHSPKVSKASRPTDDKTSMKGTWSGHVTYLKFWGSNHISGIAEATVIRFCTHIASQLVSTGMEKYVQKGVLFVM